MYFPSNKISNESILNIYSSITDSDNWQLTLDQLVSETGCRAYNIFITDHISGELNQLFCSDVVEQLIPFYVESPYIEEELSAMSEFPGSLNHIGFLEINSLVEQINQNSNRKFNFGPVNQWLRERWNIYHRYCSRLNIEASYLDVVTLSFSNIANSHRQEAVQAASHAIPHLAKAIELSRPFSLLKARFQATLDVLDRFRLAVFLLDRNGCIALKNESASRILDFKDGVFIDSKGKLKCGANSHNTFSACISRILDNSREGFVPQAEDLTIIRTSDATSYVGQVAPIQDRAVTGKYSGAIVLLIDPDHTEIINMNGMQRLFNLSEAETDVCQLLVDGLSTGEIAESRSVSPQTVRSQVKSLLSKTKSNSRTDIVKQALTINIPVDK